jgi:hypothetical protein
MYLLEIRALMQLTNLHLHIYLRCDLFKVFSFLFNLIDALQEDIQYHSNLNY